MTREKALQVDSLLVKIETFEECLAELSNLDSFQGIQHEYGVDLAKECGDVIQKHIDKFLKELEAM